VQITSRRADALRRRRHEGDHVVLDLGLDLLHPLRVDRGAGADLARRLGGNDATPRQRLADRDLDLEPDREPVLVGPQARHLGAGV